MAEIRLGEAIDALVSKWSAAGVKVWDGPVTTDDYQSAIFVGYDGGGDMSTFTSATGEQDWGPMGNRSRDETIHVSCAAVSLAQDSTANPVKAARDAALALFTTASQSARSDPSLGRPGPFLVAGLVWRELFTEPTTSGIQCRLVFDVLIKTRV